MKKINWNLLLVIFSFVAMLFGAFGIGVFVCYMVEVSGFCWELLLGCVVSVVDIFGFLYTAITALTR